LTYDVHRLKQEEFIAPILRCACDWAKGERRIHDICRGIQDNGFGTYYVYTLWGNCLYLASDFVNTVRALGILGTIHIWSSTYTKKSRLDKGDMAGMMPGPFDPIGPMTWQELYSVLTPRKEGYEGGWRFHAWGEVAQRGRHQYDPSGQKEKRGTWGEYEDSCFDIYYEVISSRPHPKFGYPGREKENKRGQVDGCEKNGIHRTFARMEWLGPPGIPSRP